MTWLALLWNWRLPVAAAAIAIGLYGAGWRKGHSVAAARCATAALTAQLIETERQRRAAEAALEAANRLAAGQAREIAALQQEADNYVAELSKRDVCHLTADDVRRLRALH